MKRSEENIYICRSLIAFIKDTLLKFFERLEVHGLEAEIVKLTFRELKELQQVYLKYIEKTDSQFRHSHLVLEFEHYYLTQIKIPETTVATITDLNEYKRNKK